MIIEIDKMNIFHILGFAVSNCTIRLVDIICNIKQFAMLGITICKFSQTSNTGRKIPRSSAYIKWLIKVPA